MIVPETATELILGGIRPFGDRASLLRFQKYVFELQSAKEHIFLEACTDAIEEKILILYDRGLLDNKAYITNEEFNDILKSVNGKENKSRDNYDLVLHLVTAANGAEDAYTLSNNLARTETVEEAIAVDNRTLNAWMGHNKLKIIDNSTDFEGKIKRTLNEIYMYLGEPVPTESYKKYLIEVDDILLDKLKEFHSLDIFQSYLTSNSIQRRLRKKGMKDDWVYTYAETKYLENNERIKKEKMISQKEYIDMSSEINIQLHSISKRRCNFVYDFQYFTIDIFSFLDNKAIMDVQVTDKNSTIEIPNYIKVIKDISFDKNYQNYNISQKLKI